MSSRVVRGPRNLPFTPASSPWRLGMVRSERSISFTSSPSSFKSAICCAAAFCSSFKSLAEDIMRAYYSTMREQSLNFLRKLVNTPSPVGHEVRGQRVWLDYVTEFADETFSDAYGNCVAVLNKGGSPRIMLAGHADEIAMAVNFITDDGYIYVRKMGGVDAAITKAQRVTIHSRQGAVKGVVGNVAPHLMKDAGDQKPPKIHEIFIDIGAKNRKEAMQ